MRSRALWTTYCPSREGEPAKCDHSASPSKRGAICGEVDAAGCWGPSDILPRIEVSESRVMRRTATHPKPTSLSSLPLFDQPHGSIEHGPPRHAVDFLGEVRAFRGFGQSTVEFEKDGVRYLVNEYWTAGQRQASVLHEVSYRACFKPQLPEFFISRLTEPGETVHDPFMGRGTTPIQAAIMGRRPSGNDINPLSILLTRPRLRPPLLVDVARRLNEVPWSTGDVERDELLAFYHPSTLSRLSALRK